LKANQDSNIFFSVCLSYLSLFIKQNECDFPTELFKTFRFNEFGNFPTWNQSSFGFL